MRKKTNQALPYGRMYAKGLQGVTSERAYHHLVPIIGSSAATTYYSLRRSHIGPGPSARSWASTSRADWTVSPSAGRFSLDRSTA